MFTFILFIIVILCLLHYLFYHNSFAKSLLIIPGPPIKFFFGNSLDVLLSPVELFLLSCKWEKMYKDIHRFYAYFHGSICIYNPEDIEVIVSSMKYHEKSSLYRFLKPWLQEGLLLSNGPKWQQRRKILTPAFHFNVLQKYYSALEDNSERLINVLEKTDGKKVDIVPVISEYTLNTICETAMGTQLKEETADAGKSYKEAIYNLGYLLLKRFVNLLLHPDFTFKLSPIGRKQSKYLAIIRKFTEKVIKERKDKVVNAITVNDSNLDLSKQRENFFPKKKKERNAMLDLLIAAERDGLIDETGIQEEVDTFMFEGHDTTATGLTYILMTLANEEEIQAKVVEELRSIFGEDTRAASMDDLNNMRYLDRCIKESLRLYPPVPFISRSIPTDTVLSGYKIPAGTICNIHIYHLHRQEHLFKNALKFDPDRFLPENSVGRHNYSYIPFSAGPRNCIGQKFAMMEMKLALSDILRNFKLIPVTKPTDLQFASDIVLRNAGPVYMKFAKKKLAYNLV